MVTTCGGIEKYARSVLSDEERVKTYARKVWSFMLSVAMNKVDKSETVFGEGYRLALDMDESIDTVDEMYFWNLTPNDKERLHNYLVDNHNVVPVDAGLDGSFVASEYSTKPYIQAKDYVGAEDDVMDEAKLRAYARKVWSLMRRAAERKGLKLETIRPFGEVRRLPGHYVDGFINRLDKEWGWGLTPSDKQAVFDLLSLDGNVIANYIGNNIVLVAEHYTQGDDDMAGKPDDRTPQEVGEAPVEESTIVDRVMETGPLSLYQFRALHFLDYHGGSYDGDGERFSAADVVGKEKGGTGTINHLEDRGLIEVTMKNPRRYGKLSLTYEGRQVVKAGTRVLDAPTKIALYMYDKELITTDHPLNDSLTHRLASATFSTTTAAGKAVKKLEDEGLIEVDRGESNAFPYGIMWEGTEDDLPDLGYYGVDPEPEPVPDEELPDKPQQPRRVPTTEQPRKLPATALTAGERVFPPEDINWSAEFEEKLKEYEDVSFREAVKAAERLKSYLQSETDRLGKLHDIGVYIDNVNEGSMTPLEALSEIERTLKG